MRISPLVVALFVIACPPLASAQDQSVQKVLPPAKVVRFVQIENKLDTLVQLRAVAKIPLAQ